MRFANQASSESEEGANRVDPDKLNELDRQILREVFKQAKRLQQLLQVEFMRS
jgi:CBS domain-containing protein